MIKGKLRKNWKLLTIILIGLATIYTFASFLLAIYEAKKYRRLQRFSAINDICSSESLKNLITRRLILIKGSELYNREARFNIYNSYYLKDNLWNRYILESDALRMSEQEKNIHLPNYPLKPSEKMMPFLSSLLEGGYFNTLNVINKSNSKKTKVIIKKWLNNLTFQGLDDNDFKFILQKISNRHIGWCELFNTYWSKFSDIQKEIFFNELLRQPKTLECSIPLFEAFIEWFENSFHEEESSHLFSIFLANKETQYKCLAYLYYRLDGSSIEEINYRLNRPGYRNVLLKYTKPTEALAMLNSLYNNTRKRTHIDTKQNLILCLFHELIHLDLKKAENFARIVLKGKDSSTRKGVVVLLARHESELGYKFIDEAFKGEAPRNTMFFDYNDYIFSSEATKEYVRLANHGYLETGKSFPPMTSDYKVINIVDSEKIQEWENFIYKYPWFPGTDDAFYHLAYSQYVNNQAQDCLQTVTKYFHRREILPDNDADPFINHMYKLAVLKAKDLNRPEHKHLKAIFHYRVGDFLFKDSSQGINQKIHKACTFFLENPSELKKLNWKEENIYTIKYISEILANRNTKTKMDYNRLLNLLDLQFDEFVEILYGVSFIHKVAVGEHGKKLFGTDFTYSVKKLANFLHDQILKMNNSHNNNSSVYGSSRNTFILSLAYQHILKSEVVNNYYQDSMYRDHSSVIWREYQSIIDSLSQIDTDQLPDSILYRHIRVMNLKDKE